MTLRAAAEHLYCSAQVHRCLQSPFGRFVAYLWLLCTHTGIWGENVNVPVLMCICVWVILYRLRQLISTMSIKNWISLSAGSCRIANESWATSDLQQATSKHLQSFQSMNLSNILSRDRLATACQRKQWPTLGCGRASTALGHNLHIYSGLGMVRIGVLHLAAWDLVILYHKNMFHCLVCTSEVKLIIHESYMSTCPAKI